MYLLIIVPHVKVKMKHKRKLKKEALKEKERKLTRNFKMILKNTIYKGNLKKTAKGQLKGNFEVKREIQKRDL